MRKTLFEIGQEYQVAPNTLRVAIHRGLVESAKVGSIRMIDDESESFKNYLIQNRLRQSASSKKPAPFAKQLSKKV
jgi:hypothetical protein